MYCANYLHILICKVLDSLGKSVLSFIFNAYVLISRDVPFGPTIRSFCSIFTLHTCEVKSFAEVFPRLEGT